MESFDHRDSSLFTFTFSPIIYASFKFFFFFKVLNTNIRASFWLSCFVIYDSTRALYTVFITARQQSQERRLLSSMSS